MTKQVIWTFKEFFFQQFDTKFVSKQQRLAKIGTILWLLLSTHISQIRARYAGEKANTTKHPHPVVVSYRPLLVLPQKAGLFKSKLACTGEES